MRVLTIATSYPRHAGDWAGRFVRDLNAGMVALGHSVETLAPWTPGLLREEHDAEAGPVERIGGTDGRAASLFYGAGAEQNARVLGAARSSLAFRDATRAFVDAIARRAAEADLVLAHWVFPSAWWASRAAPSTPIVGILHGADARLLQRPLVGRLIARSLRGALSGLVCVSERGWKSVRSKLALPPGRVVISPMGFDSSVFGAGVSARERGLVAAAGRLVPSKGFDLLVRACAGLGVRVVIAGEGPERARLAREAASARVPLELAGNLAPRDLAHLFRRAAVIAVPSRAAGGLGEGVPLVALEALACGAAVVGTRAGGLPEVLSARALAPDEPRFLRELIGAALVDPAPFRDASVASRFDRVAVARRVLAWSAGW